MEPRHRPAAGPWLHPPPRAPGRRRRHDSADSRPPVPQPCRTTRRGTRRSWPPDRAPAPERPDEENPTHPTVTTRSRGTAPTRRTARAPPGAVRRLRAPTSHREHPAPARVPRNRPSPPDPANRAHPPDSASARARRLGPRARRALRPAVPPSPGGTAPTRRHERRAAAPHGVGRQPSISSARLRSISRSRALPARSAARVNSSRASFVRPRRDRRSPRTEGSRW